MPFKLRLLQLSLSYYDRIPLLPPSHPVRVALCEWFDTSSDHYFFDFCSRSLLQLHQPTTNQNQIEPPTIRQLVRAEWEFNGVKTITVAALLLHTNMSRLLTDPQKDCWPNFVLDTFLFVTSFFISSTPSTLLCAVFAQLVATQSLTSFFTVHTMNPNG